MTGRPDSGTHGSPAPQADGARRVSQWPSAARWLLRAALAVFACGLVAAAALVAARTTPPGPTFGRFFAITGRTNVLIMGLDRTVSDQNPNVEYPVSRTDTLIAASFDPVTRRAYLLSIPRDTRALIPGHGYDKINAAHAYGGAPLTTRATENLLGVTFPYYLELHVRGLVHLVDAVGGIDVRIPSNLDYDDNWDGLHIHLKKGYRHLGGAAAAGYARFRHDTLGDIGRVGRQQQVLDALLAALRRPQNVFLAGRSRRRFPAASVRTRGIGFPTRRRPEPWWLGFSTGSTPRSSAPRRWRSRTPGPAATSRRTRWRVLGLSASASCGSRAPWTHRRPSCSCVAAALRSRGSLWGSAAPQRS